MKFFRTASTERLLAVILGVVLAVAGGTAIAVAAGSGGPVPGKKPLANAIHDALSAPTVQGITARVSFTNHLIDSSDIQGSDPVLQGASGRLWLSPSTHQARLELQSDNGDAQALASNGSFWVYEPSSKTVYEGSLPSANHGMAAKRHAKKSGEKLPSVAQIQKQLNDVMKHMLLSGAIPSDVGGAPAYTVRVAPKHDGGLLGAAELAWDSNHGVPLRIAIYARGNGSPVLELKVTNISFGAVSASVFDIKPPSDAKAVKVASGNAAAGDRARTRAAGRKGKRHSDITGVGAVSSHLSFPLVAPAGIVGLPRQSVKLLDWDGTPAALVTYGRNLGGIAVIEQPQRSAANAAGSSGSGGGDQRRGLNLPTVSINGITAQELDTALGTMVRWSAKGVTYTVVGSVPPAAADAAARAL